MRIAKVTPIGSQGPKIKLWFEIGTSDPVLRDPVLQQELRDIEDKLRRDDPGVQSHSGLQKAADASSWLTGQYAAALAAVGPTLGLILVTWLQGRAGRKVKLKVGDTEAEARTPKEVEHLLAIARAYKDEQGKAEKE